MNESLLREVAAVRHDPLFRSANSGGFAQARFDQAHQLAHGRGDLLVAVVDRVGGAAHLLPVDAQRRQPALSTPGRAARADRKA